MTVGKVALEVVVQRLGPVRVDGGASGELRGFFSEYFGLRLDLVRLEPLPLDVERDIQRLEVAIELELGNLLERFLGDLACLGVDVLREHDLELVRDLEKSRHRGPLPRSQPGSTPRLP